MLLLRAPFAFPGGLLTILDSAWLIPIVAAYAGAVTIGGDLASGTLRSILLARRSRVAYLGERLLTIAAIVAVSLAAIALVAVAVQAVLVALTGERYPPGEVPVGTYAAVLGVRFMVALSYGVVAAALTLVARSVVGGIALSSGSSPRISRSTRCPQPDRWPSFGISRSPAQQRPSSIDCGRHTLN